MEDDDIDLKPQHKTVKAKIIMARPDNKLTYFDLLSGIKNKEIPVKDLKVIDNNEKVWEWDPEINGFSARENGYGMCDNYCTFLTEHYDDIDLIDLLFTIIPTKQPEETPKYIAAQRIINDIEEKYMDLEMAIDNCQGCMDGLDIAFEELNWYKEIVKFLGGNIEAHKQELVDNWFAKAKERDEKEQQEKEKKDKVIERLPFPVMEFVLMEDERLRDYLWKENDKINEICEMLREKLK